MGFIGKCEVDKKVYSSSHLVAAKYIKLRYFYETKESNGQSGQVDAVPELGEAEEALLYLEEAEGLQSKEWSGKR